MEAMRPKSNHQGASMGKEQAGQAAAVQPLRQEETMGQPPADSRAHGGAGQQPLHRHSTSLTAVGSGHRHRGMRFRLHGVTSTTYTTAGGTTGFSNASKPSGFEDERGGDAGAPRCDHTTTDAGAVASQGAPPTARRQTSQLNAVLRRFLPSGFLLRKKNSDFYVPDAVITCSSLCKCT